MLGEKLNIRNVSLDNFCYFCIAAVASLAVFFILHNANWVNGDELEWIRSTAIGIIEPMSQHVGKGRFIPLCHYDSNLTLLLPYGYTALVHYLLVALIFLLTSIAYVKLLRGYTSNLNGVLLLVAYSFLVYETYNVYLTIIYSEKVVLLGLALFMFLFNKLHEKTSLIYLMLLCIVVLYITYAKEPVFGIFLVFSLVNLLFRRRKTNAMEKMFGYFCLLNAVVYMLLYYYIVFLHSDSFYNQGRVQLTYIQNVAESAKHQPFLIAIFGFLVYRIYAILKNREISVLDSFLLMSVAYSIAYFILKLNDGYYFTPAVILALPSMCKTFNNLLQHEKIKYVLYVFLCLLLYKSVKNIVVMGEATSYNRTYYPEYFQNLARIAEKNRIYVVTDSVKMSDLHYSYKVTNDEYFIGYWMNPRISNYKFMYVTSVDSVPSGSYVRIYDNGLKFYRK